jgi:tight adherence protein C
MGILAGLLSLGAFAAAAAGVVWVYRLLHRDDRQAQARVRELASPDSKPPSRLSLGELARVNLPAVGAPLLPTDEGQRTRLQERLYQAGVYGRHSLAVFLGAKMLLIFAGIGLGLAVTLSKLLPVSQSLFLTAGAGGLALVAPGLWLDARKKKRQAVLRRGLPDALDMLVLCLEGGVSLPAAVQRVTTELQTAHPLLGAELNIVQREMLLGLSAGAALQKLGQRADLEDVRNLASVLLQNERFGASVTKALRTHSDVLRQQRQQRAEELAQKAAVKILFPTLLCIFPAIFIVILGPAAFQLIAIFSRMK